jgi:hypothetical protein
VRNTLKDRMPRVRRFPTRGARLLRWHCDLNWPLGAICSTGEDQFSDTTTEAVIAIGNCDTRGPPTADTNNYDSLCVPGPWQPVQQAWRGQPARGEPGKPRAGHFRRNR